MEEAEDANAKTCYCDIFSIAFPYWYQSAASRVIHLSPLYSILFVWLECSGRVVDDFVCFNALLWLN